MGDFWRAQDRPDLGQVWLVRIKDPAKVGSGDAGDYRVIVTDANGKTATSSTATITVT